MAKPGKKKKVLFVLEIIVLLLFIGGLYVYGQISSRLDKIEQPELKKEKIVVNQEAPKMTGYKTYVLFGIDTRGEGSQYSAQNSDTMIIVSVNNDTKEVRMVSVYRDTLLNVGDDTYTKANAAYALGDRLFRTTQRIGKCSLCAGGSGTGDHHVKYKPGSGYFRLCDG